MTSTLPVSKPLAKTFHDDQYIISETKMQDKAQLVGSYNNETTNKFSPMASKPKYAMRIYSHNNVIIVVHVLMITDLVFVWRPQW